MHWSLLFLHIVASRSGTRTTIGSSRDTSNHAVNGRERQNSQSSLYANQSAASQLSSVYLTASHTASSSNLSTTSPTTSIPQSASSSSLSLVDRTPNDTPRKPSPLHIGARADSLPSAGSTYTSSSLSAVPPSGTPSGRSADDSVLNSWNGPHSARGAVSQLPKPNQPPSTILLTPATPGSGSLTTPASAATDNGRTVTSRSNGEPTQSTDLLDSSRHQLLSRESRISLPEEAKRYYAAMGESPGASPRVAQTPNIGSPSIAKPPNGVTGLSESPPPINGQSTSLAYAKSSEEGGEFLELDDGDSAYDSTVGDDQSGDGVDEDEVPEPRPSNGGKSTGVEDFPLPPSSPPYPGQETPSQSQAQAAALQRIHSEHRSDDAHSSYSGTTASESHAQLDAKFTPQQLHPIPPSPVPLTGLDPQPKFRALPLLAHDLPRTQVVVSHSSIRANDRGKEVLSFVISVEPAGKDSWRVEKMYSDVITLDSRVRAVLGKTLTKKLVSLPEGRLWKDHAPAKVDQRKVRTPSSAARLAICD